ncbi:MAG: response regulator transcription factor [Tannerellaceae bacterium]|jgi:DNA-binding response OmpR family regulator|nr:response regulator transcription factor [Tannerellaceae bacterium]
MNRGEQFKVFLFEKDENVGLMLQEFMQMEGVSSGRFSNADEAYDGFLDDEYTICLISLDKNPEEGFSLADKILSENFNTVLIFLAAQPSMEVLTEAYRIGADDFIRKPFILEELNARILAILKRTHGVKIQEKHIFHVGKYTLDTQKQTLSINGKSTKITTKECDLLKFMCENINLLVEREAVLKSVWKNDSFYNARSMDVYITKLRRLLKEDDSISITNIHGKGYKLITN